MATSTSIVRSVVRAILRSTSASASTARAGAAGATLLTEESPLPIYFVPSSDRLPRPSYGTMPFEMSGQERAIYGGARSGGKTEWQRILRDRLRSSGRQSQNLSTLETNSTLLSSGTFSNAVSSPQMSLDSLMSLVCEFADTDTTTPDYSSLIFFPPELSSSPRVRFAMRRSAIKQCLTTGLWSIPKQSATTTTRSKAPEVSSSAKDSSTP